MSYAVGARPPAPSLYAGSCSRARGVHRRPFRYPVFMDLLDLDELPALDRTLRLSVTIAAAVRSATATTSAAGGERPRREGLRARRGRERPGARPLLTHLPRVRLRVQPGQLLLLLRRAPAALALAIAEVNNTYGDRHRYVLPVGSGRSSLASARSHARLAVLPARRRYV